MQKPLATVGDFEKKRRALEDRTSKWGDYYICFFNYCGKCCTVAPHKSHGGLEYCYEECLNCGAERISSALEGLPPKAKKKAQKEIKWRYSRAGQLAFFYELLEKEITEQKALARNARNTIHRLAALRRK